MKHMIMPCTDHGKPIVKPLLVLSLVFTLLFTCGLAASAEIDSQIVAMPSSNSAHWRITTFSGEMPEAIAGALSKAGFSDYRCYSGAMLEEMADQRYRGTASSLSARALLAIEKDGERVLVGMAWKDKEWGLSYVGGEALLPGREFTIGASDSDSASVWYMPIRFTITYPLADGGSETYGLSASDGQVGAAPLWNPWYQLWSVTDYTWTDAEGRGVVVMNGYGAFRVLDLPYDRYGDGDENEGYYSAYLSCALDHMDSILDFPTGDAEAKRLAEDSWARFEGTDLAMAMGGVNLRKYPTTSSDSLGRVRNGALVHVLGEENGWDEPWYHVRLGALEGFVSGRYLKFPNADDFTATLTYGALTVARTLDTCTLRETPENDAAGAEFPAGTLVHVLADVDDDWLYVMAPRGDIGWEMDVEGTGGYVLASEVVQGVNVNAVID